MKKTLKKWSLILLLSALMITFLSACGRKVTSIEVEKLLDIEVRGFNGYGNAFITLNKEEMNTLLGDAKYGKSQEDLDKINYFNALNYEIKEGTTGLKNGEVLHITLLPDPGLAEASGYRLDKTSYEYTVEGLGKATEINPFKDADMHFEGKNGSGKFVWKLPKDYPLACELECRAYDLKNGDKVQITAKFSDDEAKALGIVVVKREETLTVEGLKD